MIFLRYLQNLGPHFLHQYTYHFRSNCRALWIIAIMLSGSSLFLSGLGHSQTTQKKDSGIPTGAPSSILFSNPERAVTFPQRICPFAASTSPIKRSQLLVSGWKAPRFENIAQVRIDVDLPPLHQFSGDTTLAQAEYPGHWTVLDLYTTADPPHSFSWEPPRSLSMSIELSFQRPADSEPGEPYLSTQTSPLKADFNELIIMLAHYPLIVLNRQQHFTSHPLPFRPPAPQSLMPPFVVGARYQLNELGQKTMMDQWLRIKKKCEDQVWLKSLEIIAP